MSKFKNEQLHKAMGLLSNSRNNQCVLSIEAVLQSCSEPFA